MVTRKTEKEIAFQELQNMIRPLSVADDKNEMEEYRKEKYNLLNKKTKK